MGWKAELLQMLDDDLGTGDITSNAVIPANLRAKGVIKAGQSGIVAGLGQAKWLFEKKGVKSRLIAKDGQRVKKGSPLLEAKGNARVIFAVERTALNLIGRMSGIATETAKAVEIARKANGKVKIAATRKTVLRWLDKRAVVIGKGMPHRMGLYDAFLVKSNHVILAGGVKQALNRAKSAAKGKKVEIEVRNALEAIEAAENEADIIMLDNFSQGEIKNAFRLLSEKKLRKNVKIELSGGVTLENLKRFARHDADVISMGCLTHSPKSFRLNIAISAL